VKCYHSPRTVKPYRPNLALKLYRDMKAAGKIPKSGKIHHKAFENSGKLTGYIDDIGSTVRLQIYD